MKNPNLAFALSSEEIPHLVAQAVDRIVAHFESLPNQPSADIEEGLEDIRAAIVETE